MAKKSSTRVVTRYVKRARRKASGMTLPVAVIAGFAPIAIHTLEGYKAGGVKGALNDLSAYTTGYVPADGQWKPAHLVEGMGPVILGIMVHKYVGGKMGVNRMLTSAGVPLVRL